jgi:hypothetical protein
MIDVVGRATSRTGRLATAVVAVAALAWAASPAEAQTNGTGVPYYPYCAVGGANPEGSEQKNCGFTSYEQCQRWLMGYGWCVRNYGPGYSESQEQRPARPRR